MDATRWFTDGDVEILLETTSGPGAQQGREVGFVSPSRTRVEDAGGAGGDKLVRAIHSVASRLRGELGEAGGADETSVQFGASLTAGGAVLLSNTGTFKVTVKWRKP